MDIVEIAKRVQIKELPIKTEIDRDSVLLIQDAEDTKQMPVDLFYQAITKIADQLQETVNNYLKLLQEEIDKCTEKYNELLEFDALLKSSEQERKNNEDARNIAEQERREQFKAYKDRWEIWEKFYDNTVVAENERVSNENYRVQEWARWTNLIALWGQQENQRQTNEQNRITAFNSMMNTANTTIQTMRDLITETNNLNKTNSEYIEQKGKEVDNLIATTNKINADNSKYITDTFNNISTTINNKITEMNTTISDCEDATAECVSVTNTLNDMIGIGTQVPSSLPSSKIYLQYFTS